MARHARHDERKGRRGSAIEGVTHSASNPTAASLSDSSTAAAAAASASASHARRATACGRRSISAEQRARYLKAFLVWLLFSLGGWLGVAPDYLPIYSHCVGFGFFIVMTTNKFKTRWLGALFFGGLLFAFLMYRTLPSQWVAVATNSFGYTALALSCVLVTGCTVVRRTLPSSSAAAVAASALSVVTSAAHSSQSSTTTTPERLARPRGGFASFRNKILSSSCGDSSIAKFCSGRYIEEHLESRGLMTLDEQTGRVSELHLLGSTGPALHVHVDAAVDSASQVFRRAGGWMDEVGHILVRVATDPHFIRFLKDAAAERLGDEGSPSDDDDDADEGRYEGVQKRAIHVLDDPASPCASPSPSAAAEGEREGEESQPGEHLSPAASLSTAAATVPSFSRSSSDSATAAAAAAAASQLVEAAASGVDSASFLANAPRGHLYAVIRHLNSQLLHVESSLRAAQEESERAEAQRGAFASTIRTLKASLDRECATRMQLTNQWHRQREEEAREAKRAAKQGSAGGGGAANATAGGEDATSTSTSGGSDSAHAKQLHAHVRELTKKCKQLSNEHWNASYALSLAGQKNQALQQALERATKEAALERTAAATRAREHAASAQELLARAHEEHARAIAKVNQESLARVRALETQRRALEQKILAQQNAAAASKEAAATATAAALAATASSSTSESETDSSPASSPRSSPPSLALAQLQSQLAEATHQARAQAVETSRREHRAAAQLERQSAALARLAQEKSALESSVSALQAALQDARSQLSVEQTIVSSLSTAVDDPAAAAAWHASPDARALAAIFSRGPHSSFGLNDGDDEGGSTASANSSAAAAEEFELLEASDADWTTAAAADSLDQQLLAQSMVDSVSSPLVGAAGAAHALSQRGSVQRQGVAPAPPSLLPPAALPGAATAARSSWSLYEHGGPARVSGGGGALSGYTSLAPSAALWGTAPVALGLQLQLTSGTDEHSQLSRQLDALEARIKQLKQQQLQQQQFTQPTIGQPGAIAVAAAAAGSSPTALSWPS